MRRARKRFGQHFLERAWADKVVRAIGPAPADVFVEIGPGTGALTRPLASAAAHVVAFEIDRDLAAALREEAPPNVTLVEGDFLDLQPDALARELARAGASPSPDGFRVAGNLPYNVASPILFKLAALHAHGLIFRDATVMLQREVADRLLARSGTRDYGVLTVLMGYRATMERLLALPPGAFRPSPKVESAVVRLRFHEPRPAPVDAVRFEGLVQAMFTRRRKTLANALLAYPGADRAAIDAILEQAGIDGRRRPETLDLGELVRVADAYGEARRSA
jgi:16S rRNA (adenine1518-N6/adenine1519-N6)-dimethyltransferase